MRAFAEIDSFRFKGNLLEKLQNEINGRGKDYILGVDEEEFIAYLINSFTIETLCVDFTSEIVEEPTVKREWIEDRFYREKFETDVYLFRVSYPFTGSSALFSVRPSTYIMRSGEISVNDFKKVVSFDFKLYKKDPHEFLNTKASLQRTLFGNLDGVNIDAKGWNSNLESVVRSFFQKQKNKYIEENNFFAAINVKVDSNTLSVFTTPTITKKVIPQPKVTENREYSSEPTMAKEMYDDILKVIYDFGKSMEKKPSTYLGRDEEALRDQFLLLLETRYDNTTATGETFNKVGKTDIMLKYAKDATNVFVAECKFWHGNSEFQKAISQLFDRYLTWRDSKAALMIFVNNKEFTNVLNTIKSEAKKHKYFKKQLTARGESSFSFVYRLPHDAEKDVLLEIIAFHYN